MIRYICDRCQQEITQDRPRYVVRLSILPAEEVQTLTEEDMEEDNLHVLSQTLKDLENQGGEVLDLARPVDLRFDLCDECRQHLLEDPLGTAHTTSPIDFSEN